MRSGGGSASHGTRRHDEPNARTQISSTIIFKLVCSGAASEAFIGGYLSSHASTPCEVRESTAAG